MDVLIPFLVVTGYFTVAAGILIWLAFRVRRRAIGGGLMSPVDEIFRPTAHQARIEIEVQDERMTQIPSPEDK